MKPLRVVHLVNGTGPTTVPARMAERMRERGAEVTVVSWYDERGSPEPGGETGLGARRWWDPGAARRLVERLREATPEVLHLHHTASAAAGSVAARVAGRPATVKSEHSSRARKRRGQAALDLVSLALADAVVANSDATLASFRAWERAVTRGKRRRIYNGVDLGALEAARAGEGRRAGPVAGTEPVVVSVARLVPEKNHARLLRAARIALDREGADFRLVLVGDGRLRPALEEQAAELALEGRVTFRGELEPEAVYEQLWRSDLFVVPSLSEGFCNAAVEAMAVGLPVAASDVPALREVVGEEGRYFDPADPAAIADALLGTLTAPQEERRRVGRALRERARNRFSLERTVDEHLELYRELTGRRGRAGGA